MHVQGRPRKGRYDRMRAPSHHSADANELGELNGTLNESQEELEMVC